MQANSYLFLVTTQTSAGRSIPPNNFSPFTESSKEDDFIRGRWKLMGHMWFLLHPLSLGFYAKWVIFTDLPNIADGIGKGEIGTYPIEMKKNASRKKMSFIIIFLNLLKRKKTQKIIFFLALCIRFTHPAIAGLAGWASPLLGRIQLKITNGKFIG